MPDAAELNQQQLAAWNGPMGAVWVTNEARTEKSLAPVTEGLLRHAAARVGERVLDIGCGCGGTTRALADAVGPAGHVTGLDISEPMLGVARARATAYPQIELILGDAAAHPFPAPDTDLLVSRFGVMFFGDPDAAFGNMRRALRPTGRLVFACWRPMDENDWVRVPLAAVLSVLPPMPRPGPEDPGPFAFARPERVERILRNGGFAPPTFSKLDFEMRFPGDDLRAAAENVATIGPASRALRDQPPELREAALDAIAAALEPHATEAGVRLAAAVWLVESRPA